MSKKSPLSALILVLAAGLTAPACRAPGDSEAGAQQPALPHIRSFLGQTLVAPELDPERAESLARATAEATRELEQHPGDELAFIWLGRRQAYEFRYMEAIATFTRGLARHPDSARLLRHRGHRWLTVRQPARAVEDLAAAARLAAPEPDALEPDGAPNPAGIPRSTTRSNIHYHLALAHYLLGDFGAATEQWLRCRHVSRVNDDMFVAATWWLVLSARRAGIEQGALAGEPVVGQGFEAWLLEPVEPEMDILENHAYHRLLLMARGSLRPEDLLTPGEDGVQNATLAYGVAAWWLTEGREEQARELLQDILEGPSWMAFGFMAAEAEIARMRASESVQE